MEIWNKHELTSSGSLSMTQAMRQLWNALGLSWLEGGQLAQADGCLNRAVELDPKNPDITNRARLKTAQGRFDEVEHLASTALGVLRIEVPSTPG